MSHCEIKTKASLRSARGVAQNSEIDWLSFVKPSNLESIKFSNDLTKFDYSPSKGIRSYEEFKGKINDAMLYYSQVKREKNMNKLQRAENEQKKILNEMEENEYKLEAWVWQHFVSFDLKIRALRLLDPNSLCDITFPLESLKRMFHENSDLAIAGQKWLQEHRLM